MKKTTKLFLTFIVTFGVSAFSNAQNLKKYDSRIDEKEILTPKHGVEPTINGAKVYGATPKKEFLYRIPCQGERPIYFTAKGLPKGLILDAKDGIITGTTPAQKGEYKIKFTAQNEHGIAERDFNLIIGDKLVLTPPTGWNSWGGHMLNVSDNLMRYVADYFVEHGLADVGYQYLGLDDCWERMSQKKYDSQPENRRKNFAGLPPFGDWILGNERDIDGNIIPNDSFPDMKSMTTYIHKYGLKVGIYSTPGITTCQDFEGSYGHEKQDADMFGKWGFDFIKYDLCSGKFALYAKTDNWKSFEEADYWRPMVNNIRSQDRDIVFNMCTYTRTPWLWAAGVDVNTWRFTAELNHGIDLYFNVALQLSTELREYHIPGHWADPDYLYIDYLRNWAKKWDESKPIPLNTNQRYQYTTLWSLICAPYVFSCDMYKIDEFTLRLLSNAESLNINQDELCHVAEVVYNENNQVVMVKKLADGSKAIGLFNRDAENECTVDLSFEKLNIHSKQQVRDVWRQKDLGTIENGLSVKLSPNGVAYFVVK